jgi:hypothetical protein
LRVSSRFRDQKQEEERESAKRRKRERREDRERKRFFLERDFTCRVMLKHNLLHGKTQQIGLSPKEWFGRSKFGPFSLRGNRQKTRKIFLTQLLMRQRLLTQSARKTKILLDLDRAI